MREALKLRVFTHARPVALGSAIVRRLAQAVAIAGALLVASPVDGTAHEIPKSVTILAYLKPSGDTLRVVTRVPLEAMRDIQWPLRGPGYLRFDQPTELAILLKDAAKLWIADNLRVLEDGTPLGEARITHAIVSLQSDRTFESYDAALAHASGPSHTEKTDLAWQALPYLMFRQLLISL